MRRGPTPRVSCCAASSSVPRRFRAGAGGLASGARRRQGPESLRFAIAAGLPEGVIGDPLRFARRASKNLVDNAVKFTERGSVALEVTGEPARARPRAPLLHRVRQRDRPFGGGDQAAVPSLRPSQRSDRAPGSAAAGLGLAFVKRIAKAMGGDLTVASQPGGGQQIPADRRLRSGRGGSRHRRR